MRDRSGRREEDVSMFCRCPTTGRRIKTPRKREAKSERTKGAVRDRWTENNMSARKNNEDRKKKWRSREKSGKGRRRKTEEKAGNRETAGTPGHAGWIAPC